MDTTVGIWSPPGGSPPPLDAEGTVVATLGDGLPDRLVVFESDWPSFTEAVTRKGDPASAVVLVVQDVDSPPSRADELADAIVTVDDLDSALHVTDLELADMVAALGELDLVDLSLALADPHTRTVAGITLRPSDLPRAARAALLESNHRATVREPMRRLLALDAALPDRTPDPPSVVAAAFVIALLAAGMRARGRRELRSGEGESLRLPPEQDVAALLEEGRRLDASGAGTSLAFTLTAGQVQIDADAAIQVTVSQGGAPRWSATGTRVFIPVGVLTGPAGTVTIARAADGDA